MKNFGLIGVGGYIAPRHLKAIKETDNNLSVSMDVNDSVGIIDQFFPHSEFFLDGNSFADYVTRLKKTDPDKKLDYISICSPNYFHSRHIKFSLQSGIDAICEKPVVLSPWELDEMAALERGTGKRVYTILQLRHHAQLVAFKENLGSNSSKQKKNVVLTYITGRGNWYKSSWKGDIARSGGISTNIGIHLFDLLLWFFGNIQKSEVHLNGKNRVSGFLELEDAYVSWFLSIDFDDIPQEYKGKKNTLRSILINNDELEFSDGFTDLHTDVYKNILNGNGIGIEEARPSIELVHKIKNTECILNKDNLHPIAKRILNIQ